MRTQKELSNVRFGDTMTYDEAVLWLGQSHLDWINEGGIVRLDAQMDGAWLSNNGASYVALEAIRRDRWARYCKRWNPTTNGWESAERSVSRIVWSDQLHRGVWVPSDWNGEKLTDFAHAEDAQ